MALTLAQAGRLSNDVLLIGIIETIIKDSPILQGLPFIDIVGNGLTYNREHALETAEWHDTNEAWTGIAAPTIDQDTAVLKILGLNADLDNFIKATRSNLQDIEAAQIELVAKAVRYEFEDSFLHGMGSVATKDIKGLRRLLGCGTGSTAYLINTYANYPDQAVFAGDPAVNLTGAALTLGKLDELIDTVKGGKPDLLLVSRRSRRKINALARAAGSNLEIGTGALGEFVQLYNGIPVGVSDFIPDIFTVASDGEGSPHAVETAATGGEISTIYAMQFGEGALVGLTNGGIQAERIGAIEGADATRTRIKWYCGLALFSSVKAAMLWGINAS